MTGYNPFSFLKGTEGIIKSKRPRDTYTNSVNNHMYMEATCIHMQCWDVLVSAHVAL